MIKLYQEMKNSFLAPTSIELNNSPLTADWLGGFTDGDGCFSINNYMPRLKFENHIRELELFKRIKENFKISNNLRNTKPRLNRPNSNATVCLDIVNIYLLRNVFVPLYSKQEILKTKKFKDFRDWSIIVDIYYFGYHLIPEGKMLYR